MVIAYNNHEVNWEKRPQPTAHIPSSKIILNSPSNVNLISEHTSHNWSYPFGVTITSSLGVANV